MYWIWLYLFNDIRPSGHHINHHSAYEMMIWHVTWQPLMGLLFWYTCHRVKLIHLLWRWGTHRFNSLAPRWCGCSFKSVILEYMSQIKFMNASCEIALRWMQQNTLDGMSTMVQVMALCHQAPSHYLIQCWPRSMSPYGVTRLQWVNLWEPDPGMSFDVIPYC